MAPLTWRNVDAPNASNAAQLLSGAANSLQNGASMFSNGLMDFQDRRSDDRSAAVLAQLATVKGEAGVNDFLAGLTGKIAPQDMNSDLTTALANLRTTGQGYDTTRLSNQLAVNSDGRAYDANTRANGVYDQNTTLFNRGITREDQSAAIAGQLGDRLQSAYTGGPMTPEIQAGIFGGESGGDYDALFGFSNREGGKFSNVKLTDMSVNDALQFSNGSGEYGQWVKGQVGRVATPMGAYQVVGSTLAAAKKGLGLTGSEKMTKELQDQIGEYILQTQGTGAWEGYKGPANQASISSLLGPDNLISPETIQGWVKGEYDAGETRSQDSDANRERDRAFGRQTITDQRDDRTDSRSEENYAAVEAANRIALDALRNEPTTKDALNSIVTNEDLTPKEIDAAMAKVAALNAGGAETALAPDPDLLGNNTPDASTIGSVATTIDTYKAQTAFNEGSSDTIRLQNRANEAIGDKDPAQYLLDTIPNITDNLGQIRQNIDRVSKELSVSPSVAAMMLSETTRNRNLTGRIFRDWFGNDILLDPNEAIEKGKEVFSPTAIRDATITQSTNAQRVGTLDALQKNIQDIDTQIANAKGRNLPFDPELSLRREALVQQVLDFEKNNPVYGPDTTDTPTPEAIAAANLAKGNRTNNTDPNSTANTLPTTNSNGNRNAAQNIDIESQQLALEYMNFDPLISSTLSNPNAPVGTKLEIIQTLISKVDVDPKIPASDKPKIKEALEAFRVNIAG